jgi:hypothetical protein
LPKKNASPNAPENVAPSKSSEPASTSVSPYTCAAVNATMVSSHALITQEKVPCVATTQPAPNGGVQYQQIAVCCVPSLT